MSRPGTMAYRALQVEFFLLSALIMLWTPRIPLIKDALALTNGELGRVLMFSGVAGVFFSKPVGRLVVGLGSRTVGFVALPLALVGYAIFGFADSPVQFVVGLVVSGVGALGIFTSVTTQANTHSALSGKNTLNQLSAIANIGTLSSVAVGSALLGSLSNTEYIVGGSAAIIAVFAVAHTASLREDHKEDHEDAGVALPWFSPRVAPLYVLAVALMASTTAEFSANDWSALFTRDVLGVQAPWYTVPFLAFQVAIVTIRLQADRLGARFGVARFVRGCAGASALAWVVLLQLAQRTDSTPVALALGAAAFAAAGVGIGPVYPAMMNAVALDGFPRPLVLARLFSIVTAAFVFGPGAIGSLAQAVGLSAALLLPPALLVVAGILGHNRLIAHHA